MSNNPEENFETWLKTLENREQAYEQTTGYLCVRSCFCVMGVGCDLFIRSPENTKGYTWVSVDESGPEIIKGIGLPNKAVEDDDNTSSVEFIKPVWEWFGLKDRNPNLKVQIRSCITSESTKRIIDIDGEEKGQKLLDLSIKMPVSCLNDGGTFLLKKNSANTEAFITYWTGSKLSVQDRIVEVRKHTFKEIARLLRDQKNELLKQP